MMAVRVFFWAPADVAEQYVRGKIMPRTGQDINAPPHQFLLKR